MTDKTFWPERLKAENETFPEYQARRANAKARLAGILLGRVNWDTHIRGTYSANRRAEKEIHQISRKAKRDTMVAEKRRLAQVQ